ncbi:MAG TPA: hypothetical protein VF621_12250 [Pyrinomonadaceae bacterium]|jgi:hypothetical protein
MKFMYEGQVIRRTTKCTSKRDAEEVERAYRTRLAKGEVGIEEKKPVPMFKEAMAEFLDRSRIDHASKRNTTRRAEASSKALLRYFEGKRLDQIAAEDVQRFKDWRRVQRKRAPQSQAEKGQAGDDEQAHQARDRQPRAGLPPCDAESLHQARRAGEEPRQPR